MKPESRVEMARRHVAVAEALVRRQTQLVEDQEKAGCPTEQAFILLALLHSSLQAFRDALALMESRAP